MANPNVGRICWHELMSTDIDAALKFYGALFGWTAQVTDAPGAGEYRILSMGDVAIGGAMEAPPNVPSNWLMYVYVDDVDATAKKIESLGGRVMVPPTSVPNMVRFACAFDAQGASFGALHDLSGKGGAHPHEGPARIGTFTWNELHAADQAAAAKFYGELFGWTGKASDDPSKYWHWNLEGKDIGGMMSLVQPNVPPHWLPYIAVSDVKASTTKATELGATTIAPPMDIPKTGTFSVLRDPTGAVFALFRSARA